MADKMKLFHLSGENLHGKYLYPRIPKNFMTAKGYEENKTPRISFSTSIAGALTGLSANIKGQVFFVHEPQSYKGITFVTTEELIRHGYVPDAHLTNEVWVLNPVKLKLVSVIRVLGVEPTPLKYTYGDNKVAETFRWKYREEVSTFVHLIH